jgi:HD-GYP domain-containing protein (c-di-GMP phosphodiesterase class II)
MCHGGRVFRLLALLGGLSAVLDLGTGSASDESLTRCLVATRFARHLGLPSEDVATVLYTSLLEHLGCTAYASQAAAIFGDDVATTRLAFRTDWERPADLVRTFVPGVAAATGRSRARVLATLLTAGRALGSEGQPATCEVARAAAGRLNLPPSVAESLHSVLTAWNGKGHPPLAGTAIPLSARITQVASVAVLFTLDDDASRAMTELANRRGTSLDPDLVARLDPRILDEVGTVDPYEAVLAVEPDPVRLVDDQDLAEVCRTFGDLVDLKSPSFHGHSTAVGDLAGEAARRLGIPEAERVRIAGYLHDLGRVAVSSAVWDKPGPLTRIERDHVELHPYYTERVLTRVPALADLGRIAGQHHERSDGSGYHRGLLGGTTPLPARVLAAADRYRCVVEPRPHRAARSPDEAASLLREDARAGRLDSDAVAAVLEAAGHRVGARRPRPAGLTDRQVEVLRLLAAGLSNKQIAARLVLSRRTAERHVQDVYEKIGLSSRAGAALYAMEHGLVEKTG